jgi:hypothetical protein
MGRRFALANVKGEHKLQKGIKFCDEYLTMGSKNLPEPEVSPIALGFRLTFWTQPTELLFIALALQAYAISEVL